MQAVNKPIVKHVVYISMTNQNHSVLKYVTNVICSNIPHSRMETNGFVYCKWEILLL